MKFVISFLSLEFMWNAIYRARSVVLDFVGLSFSVVREAVTITLRATHFINRNSYLKKEGFFVTKFQTKGI